MRRIAHESDSSHRLRQPVSRLPHPRLIGEYAPIEYAALPVNVGCPVLQLNTAVFARANGMSNRQRIGQPTCCGSQAHDHRTDCLPRSEAAISVLEILKRDRCIDNRLQQPLGSQLAEFDKGLGYQLVRLAKHAVPHD